MTFGIEDVREAEGRGEGLCAARILMEEVAEVGRGSVGGADGEQHERGDACALAALVGAGAVSTDEKIRQKDLFGMRRVNMTQCEKQAIACIVRQAIEPALARLRR